MKRGSSTLVLIILSGLVFLAVGALTAADVPADLMIENQGYKTDKKGPVKFSHEKHSKDYGVACTDCHHEYSDGKNTWKEGDPVKKCNACHDPIKTDGNVHKLQTAFHKNCKDCHKEHKDKNAPYKKCNDCHQKKS